MEKAYVAAYHSYLDAMSGLSDAECGRLFRAMLTYSITGDAPELRGNERFVFPGIRSQMDRDARRYEERCEQNRRNIRRRWDGSGDSIRPYTKHTKDKEKEKEKAKEKEKEKDILPAASGPDAPGDDGPVDAQEAARYLAILRSEFLSPPPKDG